ncbi:DUF2147 domain-containing protein [Rhodobacteraceae bacterium NNCM2]|nr:DUF2147 domain-containing protein [Coraliihabitans acroporae]
MKKTTVTAAIAFILLAATAHAKGPAPYGMWLTENKRAIVEIAPCSENACGRIVWMANAYEADGTPKRDVNNPDKTLRTQPLCGLTLVGDLTPDEKNAEMFGYIYNPRDGKKYDARISSLAPDKIEMRGYLGLVAFGKSETWTRVNNPPRTC